MSWVWTDTTRPEKKWKFPQNDWTEVVCQEVSELQIKQQQQVKGVKRHWQTTVATSTASSAELGDAGVYLLSVMLRLFQCNFVEYCCEIIYTNFEIIYNTVGGGATSLEWNCVQLLYYFKEFVFRFFLFNLHHNLETQMGIFFYNSILMFNLVKLFRRRYNCKTLM